MTNEEINVLINLHIEELEKNIQPTEAQRVRLIKALRELIENEPTQSDSFRKRT